MKNFFCLMGLCFLVYFLSGCQTTKQPKQETTPEIISAIGSMTEGLTNQDISQEDLKRVAKQAHEDPEVKQAIESVNNAMQATQTGIKFCPKDGRRFSSRVSVCTACGTTLVDLE